jgi:hypothetical protein
MHRKGIRGTWNSPAGANAFALPTAVLEDRDMAIGRMTPGASPLVDAQYFGTNPVLGAYAEQDSISQFELQLNRPIKLITAFTDSNNPDITANTFPFDVQWPSDRKLILSHALIGYGWDMNDSASGVHDSDYEAAVDNLIQWKERIFSIRIGWEFNANNGYPWSIGGSGGTNQSAATYAASFANFAKYVREKLPGVLIDWCPLSDHTVPDAWYPGDEYVDIIGNDVYIKSAFHLNSFAESLNQTAGLYWQEAFAQTHGKLQGYPEWGTDYTDGAAWITAMAEWMRRPRSAGRVIYQSYWNSDSVVTSALTPKPLNLAAYKAAFGEI